MKQTIKVNEVVKDKAISKLSNGVNIFNKMLSEYKKNNEINSFSLDFSDVKSCTVFVFAEIVRQMQSRLEGNFGLEVINGNALIVQQFKMALR